jgi:hypothetical protein
MGNGQMNNQELLAELQDKLERGELHPDSVRKLLPKDLELVPLEESGAKAAGEEQATSYFTTTRLLYIVGGIFIVLGVLYLVSQLWGDLATTNRIMITLGLGVIFAGLGSALMIFSPDKDLGNVFHVIGGFLIPGGALVTLDELGVRSSSTWPVALTIAVVFVFYVLLVLYHKKVVLSFFAFANGSALLYLLLDSIMPSASADEFAYLTMAVGASYVIYGYLFSEGWNDRLTPFLYFFGPAGFYLAGFSEVVGTRFMEMLYPFLAFGGLVLALIVLNSRIVLLLSTGAVIAYIIYITAEYFADSIGWPVALILLGFIIIGVGYVSIALNRKYLSIPVNVSGSPTDKLGQYPYD